MKILVIEDILLLRTLLRHLLMTLNGENEVVLASNGVEGLSILETQNIDLVFTDENMPGQMQGLDVLRELQMHQPHIPACLMSGRMNEEMAHDAMKLGAISTLLKPHTKAQLREAYDLMVASLPLKS